MEQIWNFARKWTGEGGSKWSGAREEVEKGRESEEEKKLETRNYKVPEEMGFNQIVCRISAINFPIFCKRPINYFLYSSRDG